jgi:UDP-GlcNAc:undecaprenyl-phosphate GlcNAc-1-phosphate transferase
MGLSSFLLGIALIYLLKKVFLKSNIFIHQGIPLIGGLSIWLSFVLAYLVVLLFSLHASLSRVAIGIIFTSGIMLVFGIVDDWRELSIQAKFLVQIIATSFLFFFGIRTNIAYLGKINVIITLVWVIGITNAFNHLDIIDGLAAGTAVIVSLSFFIISVLNRDISTAILVLALSGAFFSLLTYNFPPARVYMGNAGSHFSGFILAAIALVISYAPSLERKIALFSPLLILGLPIFDTAFLILMRVMKKSLPFKKSNDHLALRFLALGYSKKKTLLAMLVLSVFFALCGILVSQWPNLPGAVIVAVAVLASLVLTYKMGKVTTYV